MKSLKITKTDSLGDESKILLRFRYERSELGNKRGEPMGT